MVRLHGVSISNYYSTVKVALLEKNVPFEEIAPNTLHPVFRETIQTLLRQLVDDKLVRKIAPSPLSETKE